MTSVSRYHSYSGILVFILTFIIAAHAAFPTLAASAGGGAADNNRLLDTLLSGYRPETLPRLSDIRPIEVKVGIGIIAVVDLDSRTQILKIRGFVRLLWKDELLQWKPSEYGNITYVILSQFAVWRPDITLENSLQENIYVGSDETLVWLNHEGLVSWQPAFNSDFVCTVDVVKYPMDVNTCFIRLVPWMHDNTHVNLTLMDPHTVLQYDVRNGQFDIEIGEPTERISLSNNCSYDYMYFRLQFSRKPAYIFLSLLVPMFLVGLLNVVSFMIPVDSDSKADLSLNILLATAVLIGSVHDDLPDRSDEISSLVVYVLSLLVLSFLGVVGNTLVLLVHRQDDAQRQRESDRALKQNPASSGRDELLKSVSHLSLDKHPILTYSMSSDNSSPDENVFVGQSKDLVTDVPCAHVLSMISGSRAARLNFLFLIASFMFLIGSSIALIVKIY
ncbi:hypothetical protein RRG08_045750 [Elysia crispata]|uniref:Uncharacterized protein n=1 Tax=Elysia crispata TaxID=231223 RepID=A0AAE0Z8S7_9GAST|nr:hypothetical protein RRG08_045750 [Elysia crispata]